MRLTPKLGLAALLTIGLVAACVAERPTALHEHAIAPNNMLNQPSGVDTGGGRLPDLMVDYQATAQHWVVRQEKLAAEFCSVIEGGVSAGNRRLLRFTVTTPNIGDADVFVGSPLAHADPNGDGDFSDSDGMFEYAPCHNHFHFRNYAIYKLIDANTGQVWRSSKKGFCMLDTDPNPAHMGQTPAGGQNYMNCGTKTAHGFQGVSHGWADTYMFFLGGQYFVLDGGDGQPVVPPGDYIIEVTVNPGYTPERRRRCTLVTDPATGLCHNFAESNYANNTTRIPVTIPAHVGREGFGPEKGANIPEDREIMKGEM